MSQPHQLDKPQPDKPNWFFRAGVQISKLCSWANIGAQEYKTDDFLTSSPGAGHIGWSRTESAEITVEKLAGNPDAVVALSRDVLKAAEKCPSIAMSHYRADPAVGHADITYSRAHTVPKTLAPWLGDVNNNNAFRLLLNSFLPFGEEVSAPAAITLEDFSGSTGDPFDDMVMAGAGAQRRARQEHAANQWASNAMVVGRAELGRSGVIHLSNHHVVRTPDNLVVRWSLASTDGWWHVFDGHRLWASVTDLNTMRTCFYGVGGGGNRQSFYNGVNSVTGAFVFGLMAAMFAGTLNAARTPERLAALPGPDLRIEAVKLLDRQDPTFRKSMYAALALDTLGTTAALWRAIGMRAVTTGPPSSTPPEVVLIEKE